jgi:hypothetical protein
MKISCMPITNALHIVANRATKHCFKHTNLTILNLEPRVCSLPIWSMPMEWWRSITTLASGSGLASADHGPGCCRWLVHKDLILSKVPSAEIFVTLFFGFARCVTCLHCGAECPVVPIPPLLWITIWTTRGSHSNDLTGSQEIEFSCLDCVLISEIECILFCFLLWILILQMHAERHHLPHKNVAHKFNDKNFVSPVLVRRPGSKGSDFVLKRAPNIYWLSWASTVTISLYLPFHTTSQENYIRTLT